MTPIPTVIDSLKRQRGEWAPWLAVVDEGLRDVGAPRWDAAVPSRDDTRSPDAPLLAGAALSLDLDAVRGLFRRLVRVASRSGTAKMATLRGALDGGLDVLTLFNASLCQDAACVTDAASRVGADPDALQAVAALLPVPFLQACNRSRGAAVSAGWAHGYCPVCASWPAFAESRSIERNHYFRCGRCGGEWLAHILSCPYCATCDHDGLVALVPENSASHAVINACNRCRGYVKTFTTLRGCPPAAVMLEDLGSVDLDVAAVEQGYTRRAGAGYALDVTAEGKSARRRFSAWM